MPPIETPPDRFKAFRNQLGLSGQALAHQLGVTKTAVSYWESGRVSLSRTACLLAQALFRVSAAWLLEGDGPMWLSGPAADHPDAPDLMLIPLVTPDAFLPDGTLLAPRDSAPCLGLPREVHASLRETTGADPQLFFLRAEGHGLEPTVCPEDWILLDIGLDTRTTIRDHAIYLLRAHVNERPALRRLAVDPRSGDILSGLDLPGQVPLRMEIPSEIRPSLILGRACWIGGLR